MENLSGNCFSPVNSGKYLVSFYANRRNRGLCGRAEGYSC